MWNQLIWTINEALAAYQASDHHTSWKVAFTTIYRLKTCILVACTIPFLISIGSGLILFFVLLMSFVNLFTGDEDPFYLFDTMYEVLPIEAIETIIGSVVTVLLGIGVWFFAQRSLGPLTETYVGHIAKHVSSNLTILNEVYAKYVEFEMDSFRVNGKLLQCKAEEMRLAADLKIRLLGDTLVVVAVDDDVLLDAFNDESPSRSENDKDGGDGEQHEDACVDAERGGFIYHPVNSFTNDGNLMLMPQTEISISIDVADGVFTL